MSGNGNDPFSGSSTRNLLQHTLSPKIVSDGSNGYTVKVDLINVDNIYATGSIYSSGGVVGATGSSSTVVANGITAVAVTNALVTANSVIILTLKTVGGTVGPAYVSSTTAGTGFSIKSQSGDTSTYNYLIIN
uniref:K1 capsule-specific polysaccharide lyase C-terminal domain-containing protein n=1 Tax=viral metagenome TaxID=1070528 RepID=A0A6C0AJA9_9ZZZZ